MFQETSLIALPGQPLLVPRQTVTVASIEHMPAYFRAVAVDYDGTLTLTPQPEQFVLDAIRVLRRQERAVVLVTGRILSELVADFPGVAQHFDAIVAENGAVLFRGGRERALVPRVSEKLEQMLRDQGIPLRRGAVILAMDAIHDGAVRKACVDLDLDAQLVRNRGALMVLPAGVSKAFGLRETLAELGVSYHSTIGLGDAEDDLALLEGSEIGVAVGNAVESLKERADLVLENGPSAVARFLREMVPRGLPGVHPERRRVELGIADTGKAASVPASRVQVFIDGRTGAGKSYVAGLFAEGLVRMGYTLCVLDIEGDHAALGELRGVLTLGGREPLPPVEEVARIIRHRFSSIVLDLSLREPGLKYAYARDVLDALTSVRSQCGLPHWVFVEEAHAVSHESLDRARQQGSLCLITYHPDWLPEKSLQTTDVLITVEAPGYARMRSTSTRGSWLSFQPAARQVGHVRHRRKYAEGCVPYERGFTFRDASGWIGPHAVSLSDFRREVARVPSAALIHHAGNCDFSRWIREVFQDKRLAAAVQRAEESLRPLEAESFRQAIDDFLVLRYEIDDTLPP